jgi:serine/threonine-protein kinase
VALKLLHDRTLTNPDAVARFEREAMAAARLRHPHVVEVLDYGTHEGTAFLAMELLEGESLQALIRRAGALPEAMAIDLLLPIVSAVAAVHEAGVVHRDLKPENILLTVTPERQWHPKLLDFGIAKVDTQGPELTRTNALLGTPCYMSPEQVMQARTIDGRSDQWSIGVLLYEALTARKPFYSETLLVLMTAITSEEPAPLRSVRGDVHPTLEAIVHRCLQRRADDRFPSMRELGSALLPFASAEAQQRWYSEFNDDAALSYVATSVAQRGSAPPRAPRAPARPSFHAVEEEEGATRARQEALPPLDEPTELVNTTSQDGEFPQGVLSSMAVRMGHRSPARTQIDPPRDEFQSDTVGTGTLVADAHFASQRPPTGRVPHYKATVEMSQSAVPSAMETTPASVAFGMTLPPVAGAQRSSTVLSVPPDGLPQTQATFPPLGHARPDTLAPRPPTMAPVPRNRGWVLLLSVALLGVAGLVGAIWFAMRPRTNDGVSGTPTPTTADAPVVHNQVAADASPVVNVADASVMAVGVDAAAVVDAAQTVATPVVPTDAEVQTTRDRDRVRDRDRDRQEGDRNVRTQRRDAGTRRRQDPRTTAPIF